MIFAVGVATLAVLFYRLATATRPRRRALIPVYAPAVMLTVPVLIFHGVVTHHLDLDPRTISDVGWSLTVGRALLPSRVSAFDRGEHILCRDGADEKDRQQPGSEPECP